MLSWVSPFNNEILSHEILIKWTYEIAISAIIVIINNQSVYIVILHVTCPIDG